MWQSLAELVNAIHFEHPAWLWGWPLSASVVLLLLRRNWLVSLSRVPDFPGASTYRHPRMSVLRALQAGAVRQRTGAGAFSRGAHYAVLLLCIHAALAQPYRLGRQVPEPPAYRDTVFVIDTSVSMVLRDYLVAGERIDRMTILKSVLTHFVEQLKGNRIGLIVFSEQAYTLAPLTADYGLLKSRIRRLEPAVLTGRTSDLSKALVYTLRQLQQTPAATPAQNPVLVLVTDVNRSDRDMDPRAVAAHLRAQGYRLHAIGIGASSEQAQERDSKGGLLYHPANFALLQAIARMGGGRFYWADNAGSLQAAIQTIQSAERRQVKAEPRYVTIPLYHWPLLAGLSWIVLAQVWPGRRNR